jgi:anion-transporting  ArsA/GET3 family ATPase
MVFEELLARRLVLLSGKGGVGKSLLGASLALAAARRGKKVLLVEVDTPEAASALRYFGEVPAGPGEVSLRPGLDGVNLDPPRVMEEYIRRVVRLEFFVRRILGSPIYQRFFAAAPGLKELMVLGKIMVLVEEKERQRRQPRFDLVVVDAPATGHGLSYLEVPSAASRAVPVGPVGANARRIEALLRDPRRTALAVVAVPEEMAVVEAIEFCRGAREKLGLVPSAVFLNARPDALLTPAQHAAVLRLGRERGAAPGLSDALSAARRHWHRVRLAEAHERRLRREVAVPVVCLPQVAGEAIGPAALERLADRVEAA